MRKKKLNVKNLIIIILFLISCSLIVYDLLFLFFNISKSGGWTLYGLISFLLSVIVAQLTFDCINENLNKKKRK